MACIKDYVTPQGTRIRIYDDCYRTASKEEIQRRRENFNRIAYEMLRDKMERAQKQEVQDDETTPE